MKKHELLVPAGNMDCLRQAVWNGCDAVYLACKNFGARKFANNFDQEEILEAISFCHLYGVRIYVTMNTLVKDDEVDSFIEQASFLHQNGVDALIVQDFGMICLLRNMFPNLEIHASTQANISSKEICQLYYDLGVKRVVFSRELTIDEQVDLE
jgi:putative protease